MVKIEKRTIKFALVAVCIVAIILAMAKLSRDDSDFVVNPQGQIEAQQTIEVPVSSPEQILPEENKGESGESGEYQESEKININTADEKELDKIYGVGEKTAKRIVAYREEHGDFKTIEDIMKVSGIGIKKFESMKNQITVNGGTK